MIFYETIFIVKSDLSDEELAKRVEWTTDIITSNGAQVVNIERWGKKRLAYQVKKQRFGTYVLIHYEGEPKVVPELERNFKLSEDILKYQTVKLEGAWVEKARAAAAKAAEQAKEKAAQAEAAPEAEAEGVEEVESAPEAAAETSSEAPKEAEEVESAPEAAAETSSGAPKEAEEGESTQTTREEE